MNTAPRGPLHVFADSASMQAAVECLWVLLCKYMSLYVNASVAASWLHISGV